MPQQQQQQQRILTAPTSQSRRRALTKICIATIATSTTTTIQQKANAAPPMTIGETENVKAKVERSICPKPVKSSPPKLSLNFAVLLMRSSYNALNAIDCVVM
eukprot:10335918-Ditylum_brightwellii.AAC.1